MDYLRETYGKQIEQTKKNWSESKEYISSKWSENKPYLNEKQENMKESMSGALTVTVEKSKELSEQTSKKAEVITNTDS